MRRARILVPVLRLDRAIFKRVARTRTPWLDRALPALSHAANNSRLWLGVAGLLSIAKGRRGQRAALRGVGSIAVTSALVNLGLKPLVRRRRPKLRSVPARRRPSVQPLTTSFPSGHAASAAAFAVGASLELPRAAVPLGGLAAAVAYSRVYVGVHYPLDVAAGAAIGAGVALLSRLQWPVLPAEAEREPPAENRLGLEPIEHGEGVAIVANPASGRGLLDRSLDELRASLPQARIRRVERSEELEGALREAAGDCRVLGVAGGDGSVAAAARVAIERELPLLVIPTGTLNHFARDLRIESPADALEALARGEGAAVDVGVLADHLFVNIASLGGYPAMLEIREELERRIGRWPAHLVAIARAVAGSDPVDVAVDGEPRRVWMIFIGNCRHEPAGFAPSWRPRLDDGLLDVRLLSGERPLARVRLLLSVLAGRLTRSAAYERELVPRLRIESTGGAVPLALDGDTVEGPPSFTVEKLRRRLAVYAPDPTAPAGDRALAAPARKRKDAAPTATHAR